MKNYELLDMIGEVSEDYVLAADSDGVRPRSRWKTWGAMAACAALAVGVCSIWTAGRPHQPMMDSTNSAFTAGVTSDCASEEIPDCDPEDAPEESEVQGETLVQSPGLHPYFLIEGVQEVKNTVSKDPPAPFMVPYGPVPEPIEGAGSSAPALAAGAEESIEDDAPMAEDAANQYDGLLRGMGVYGSDALAVYPEWYGGAWLDEGCLTVAIVYGFRTPELENQIVEWCGGTQKIIFTGAIYSQNRLDGLMQEMGRVFEELDCHIFSTYGVYVSDNCIHLDFFEVPGDEVLAALAELDPDGGAIFIQVFTGRSIACTDETAKAPALADPTPELASIEAGADPTAEPALVEADQGTVPAVISIAPEELPEDRAQSRPAASE